MTVKMNNDLIDLNDPTHFEAIKTQISSIAREDASQSEVRKKPIEYFYGY
jgi:hypothetical protein